MRTLGGSLLVALATLGLSGQAPAQSLQKIAESLPTYKRTTGVTGRIKSVGSDTMANLMTLWTEGFVRIYPAVRTEVEAKGSTTAPPALIDGTANFGPMSRVMKDAEIDAFKKKYGYEPTPLRTSIDMVAVYVNKDNPIAKKGLTFAQVDAIFSSTRKQGHKAVSTWGDLGLTGEWASKPISIYGRNAASGTYGFFKQNVLLNGDYKAGVKEQPGSAAVVQGVARDKYAIGYSGIGYETADVEAIPLARDKDGEPVPAKAEKAYAGDYPLARPLYVYINYDPTKKLDPLRAEFLEYIFSKQGQLDVIKAGYLPVGRAIARKDLKSVGLTLGK
jgi:phosphate transport system substrate-binding protein